MVEFLAVMCSKEGPQLLKREASLILPTPFQLLCKPHLKKPSFLDLVGYCHGFWSRWHWVLFLVSFKLCSLGRQRKLGCKTVASKNAWLLCFAMYNCAEQDIDGWVNIEKASRKKLSLWSWFPLCHAVAFIKKLRWWGQITFLAFK